MPRRAELDVTDRFDKFHIAWIAGDRHWEPFELVEREIDLLHAKADFLLVISGGAPGVDRVAREVCGRFGLFFAEIPAAWGFFKKRAGPIRNGWMTLFKPNELLAFHRDLDKSRGTADAVRKAQKLGIPWKAIKR